MKREAALNALQNEPLWDFVVIGGGASGLGVALEAAARGYKTLLVEQVDFAKSTSGKSTKLIHGGVRYLEQGDLGLVREASRERGWLCENAPHLVRNLAFVIPVYTRWDALKYTLGLKFYDWIAGRLSLGDSQFISREETLRRLPTLDPALQGKELRGGVLYHDGQFDDSRLAVNLAQTLFEAGGFAINYAKAIGLPKDAAGRIEGVMIEDQESGKIYTAKTRAAVNATGVFVDDLLRLDQPSAQPSVRFSRGSHLVLDRSFLPSESALMIPKTSDDRVLFVLPWHERVVVGTTDVPVKEASLEPVATREEIDFILETAGACLAKKPERSDILSIFSGLRPLAIPADKGQKTLETPEISRRHKITVSPSSLFTLLGGKWTIYRRMGQDMVDRVERTLGWHHKKSPTRHLKIHGHAGVDRSDPFYIYGSDAPKLRSLETGGIATVLNEKLKIHEAQVIWAAREEMARTVEDVLARRTRTLLLDARESMALAPPVAEILRRELGQTEQWAKQQVADFQALAKAYLPNYSPSHTLRSTSRL